jgi:hypothetical protein
MKIRTGHPYSPAVRAALSVPALSASSYGPAIILPKRGTAGSET